MKFSFHKSQLAKLIEQRNAVLVLASGLLVLCVILATIIMHLIGQERTIVTPPVLHRSFWISNSEVSPEYLSEMTAFFAYLRFNLTPDNLAHQRDTLLHYTDPAYYGSMKNDLTSEGEHITQDHISTAFYPILIQTDPKHLRATIMGDLHSFMGKDPLPQVEVTYEVAYSYDSGKLLIKSFSEVKAVKEESKLKHE